MPNEPTDAHRSDQHRNPAALEGEDTRSRRSSVSSHDTWNSSASDDEEEEQSAAQLPDAPRSGPDATRVNRAQKREDLPAALRAGPPNGAPIRSQLDGQSESDHSQAQWWSEPQHDTLRTPSQSRNPYIQRQQSGQGSDTVQNSQQAWHNESIPPRPTGAPPPPPVPVDATALPSFSTPSEELAGLDIGGSSSLQAREIRAAEEATAGLASARQEPTGMGTATDRSGAFNPWQEDLDRKENTEVAPRLPPAGTADDSPSLMDEAVESKTSTRSEPIGQTLGKSSSPLVNVSRDETGVTFNSGDSLNEAAKKQRNEFYHIKHINWYDRSGSGQARGRGSMRRSPILTQNANGPCPLLALVNALSLSTPLGLDTAFLETLRTREQITLGLLLDAVFEELVRRNDSSGHDLPDIGELYQFLITLHTGMNVNPRFVASRKTTETPAVFQEKPGTFEQTKDMQLYGTFDIALIHGWIVPSKSHTSIAFQRSAPTYDEALTIQFREEELLVKLSAHGLSDEDQQTFEDVASIKQFLSNYPTQLTDFGLETMSKWMEPGQIAILFRNDHFSTLYKQPQTGVLMTLVTDAGYSTHDEIVWESLVDVSGAASEMFSGDFRPVGNTSGVPSSDMTQAGVNSSDDLAENGWQTVQPRKQRGDVKAGAAMIPASQTALAATGTTDNNARTATEQEDHDLALALQLQEEEEDSNQRERERRQREENLSREFLDREHGERPPQIPPRRSHGATGQPSTPVPIRPSARTGDDTAPPPSYSEAANDRPYREAGSTPSGPQQGNALGALSALDAQRHQSAFAAQSSQYPQAASPSNRRRTSGIGGRMGRQQSQQSGYNGAPHSPGAYGGINNGQAGSTAQLAPGSRVPEEKCTLM